MSADLKIDLNAKDHHDGQTAFHLACNTFDHSHHFKSKKALLERRFEIAEMLVDKSAEFNIDLNVKDEDGGWTGFQLACRSGHLEIGKSNF